MKRVFGGVVVDVPAFQQHAAEGAVGVVFHQIFQPAATEIGDLRPVPGAGVLQRLGFHLHPQRAAHLRRLLRAGRGVQAKQAIGRHRRGAQRRGAGQEFPAAERAFRDFFRVAADRWMQFFRGEVFGHSLFSLRLATFLTLCRLIRLACGHVIACKQSAILSIATSMAENDVTHKFCVILQHRCCGFQPWRRKAVGVLPVRC